MKIQLLIALSDGDYTEHLSAVLAEKHADTFEVSVCTSRELFDDMLVRRKFDVALLEPSLAAGANLQNIRLPLMLWDGASAESGANSNLRPIRKYQRISEITRDLLEQYAEVASVTGGFGSGNGNITVVWSPAGGTGKTTVALAYAAQRVSGGKQVTYLDLEYFSSAFAYFPEAGKSISRAFERIDGNLEILLKSIRQQDNGSGITYFLPPENYDDMNELTVEDIVVLARACAKGMDELVIDLPSICDKRTRQLMDIADKVLLVTDYSRTAQVKLDQFLTQHNVFERIRAKTMLVANKGAKIVKLPIEVVYSLPYVQSGDTVDVYKTLSGCTLQGQG